MNVWERVLAEISGLRERHDQLNARLNSIDNKLEKIMSDQATETQFASEVETDVEAINAAVQTALSEIAALQQAEQAGQPLDWSALTQALTDLGDATTGVSSVASAAAPAQPAAPVDTTPPAGTTTPPAS